MPHAPGSRVEVVAGRGGGKIVVLRKAEVLVQPLTVPGALHGDRVGRTTQTVNSVPDTW